MNKIILILLNRIKNIKIDHANAKLSQLGDKAMHAVNDIDVKIITTQKTVIKSKIAEFVNRVRWKLKQMRAERQQRKINKAIEKSRKKRDRKLRREAFVLKIINFFNKLSKILILITLIGILLGILFPDEIKQLKVAANRMQEQLRRKRIDRNVLTKKTNISTDKKTFSYVYRIYKTPDDIVTIERYCRNNTLSQEKYEKCMYVAGQAVGRKIKNN